MATIMKLTNVGLLILYVFSHIFLIASLEEEEFIPSARVIYIKKSPDGPIIKNPDHISRVVDKSPDQISGPLDNSPDHIASPATSEFSGYLLSLKSLSQDKVARSSKAVNINEYSIEGIATPKNITVMKRDTSTASLNSNYDDGLLVKNITNSFDVREGRSLFNFPYEYWKPNSNVVTELDSKASESEEKINYGFYYGDPVDNIKEFDSNTWTVHPIKLPIDIIGEVNEKTTKNPLKEQTNYPSSIIPQYGRHPGATEAPPLYFPNSLSSKSIEKPPQIFRDRVGMESYSTNLKYKSRNFVPVEYSQKYRRPPAGQRKDLHDNISAPSQKIEIINTDRNSDPPPHIFYPLTDSAKLKVGLLRKNKTHSFYSAPYNKEHNLISKLHDKTRQIFKPRNGPKPKNAVHEDHKPDYDILDFSRYNIQRNANPKIARKKYNENLIDIIKDKFIKNQNSLDKDDFLSNNIISHQPNSWANTKSSPTTHEKNRSGNHGKQIVVFNSVNTTNLVKHHSGHNINNKEQKTQNMRYQNPRHGNAFTNPTQKDHPHSRLTSTSDHSRDYIANPHETKKPNSEKIYNKRPNFQMPPRQDTSKLVKLPFTSKQKSTHTQKNIHGQKPNGVSSPMHNKKPAYEKIVRNLDESNSNQYSNSKNPSSRRPYPKKQESSNYLEQPKPSWLESFYKRPLQEYSRPSYSKPSKPEYFQNHKPQHAKQDNHRPTRPTAADITRYSNPDQYLEAPYDNSLGAKLTRLWNSGFKRSPKPTAPNAYPQFGHSSPAPTKDSKNLLYYYFDSQEEANLAKPGDKTFLERIASIQNAPAAVVIPGGLAAFGLGLAYYYFNYIWYPTPVVTARLSDLLITFADNNIFSERQKSEIEKVVEVFSGLESNYISNAINSVSCRNRLVCQLHQDIPSLWEVTQMISPVVSSHLAEQSPDEVRALKNYMNVAKQGVDGINSCKELFQSCNVPYMPLKPLLNSIFKGSSKTDNEHGESRVL